MSEPTSLPSPQIIHSPAINVHDELPLDLDLLQFDLHPQPAIEVGDHVTIHWQPESRPQAINLPTDNTVQPEHFPALDPAIENLVNHLVQARLLDLQQQRIAQENEWRARETGLLQRQEKLLHDIQELHVQLQSSHDTAQPPTMEPPNPIPVVLPDNAPRKRQKRRRSIATVPDVPRPGTVPDVPPRTGPANNTRLARRRAAKMAESTQRVFDINQPSTPMEDVLPTQPVSLVNPSIFPAIGSPLVDAPTLPTTATPTALVLEPLAPASPLVPRGVSSTRRQQNQPAPVPEAPTTNRHQQNITPPSPTSSERPIPAAKKPVVKPAGQIYRTLQRDLPDDAKGLKSAMHFHIRILWGLLNSWAVPQDPPAQLLADFNRRFSNEEELQLSQLRGPPLIPLHLVQIGTKMATGEGIIAKKARLVEENILQYTQARLSRLGLNCWCPDLRQTPYSLYNSACRIVAIDTFKQALVSHAYIHYNAPIHYANEMDLLIKLFDHFTFHVMYERYKKNIRIPGSVEKELQLSPEYQRRSRLAKARLAFLVANGYRQRYKDLINTKATSDDEYDEDQKVWFIKRRPERSVKAEAFIRLLDLKRKQYARQTRTRKSGERIRVVPAIGQKESSFTVLPVKMPVDYYDPDFFNNLLPKIRNQVVIPKVAFLPNIADSFRSSDEKLSDAVFTQKYGRDVFESYRMVSDVDLAADMGSLADISEEDHGSGSMSIAESTELYPASSGPKD